MPPQTIPRGRKSLVAARFTRKLLAWYRRHARDLPWRRTRDPYRVLVSEVMLQQTQVRRVEEFYPRFLERFPTVERLACARPRAVREAWDGLGYYARASNLHALARVVRQSHAGKIPDDPQALLELPGVGRYTAGAVASFAYEQPVAAVDTNVARVVRRVFIGMRDTGDEKRETGNGKREPGHEKRETGNGKRETGHEKREGKRIWELAQALVPRDGKRAWAFNQAIMELGAVICKARAPRCPECPVRSECKTGRR